MITLNIEGLQPQFSTFNEKRMVLNFHNHDLANKFVNNTDLSSFKDVVLSQNLVEIIF